MKVGDEGGYGGSRRRRERERGRAGLEREGKSDRKGNGRRRYGKEWKGLVEKKNGREGERKGRGGERNAKWGDVEGG